MDTKGGVFIAIAVTLVIFNVTAVRGQGNTTFTLTPLDKSHLTTSFRLDCSFVYTDSVSTVQSAQFYRKRETEPKFSQVARVEVSNDPVYAWNDTTLQARSTLSMINRTFVRMEVSNIGCNDKAEYRCTYYVRDRENEYYISSDDKQLVVTAPPRKPQITYSPNIIVENEPVTVTCSGNVGLPAGSLGIFVVKSGEQPVDLNANNGLIEVESNGCTFQRTAIANYNFTDQDDGRTKILCKVQQTYANDVDHSVQTDFVSVMYTPRGTEMYRAVDNGNKVVIPPGQSIEVPVQSDVRLECVTRSSPASLYEWSYVLVGTNDTVTESPTSSGTFQLDSITQSKAGNYKCMVSNRIKNLTFTAEASFRLNVSNIPTVPPTETPTDSSSTETQPGKTTKEPGPVTQPSQAGVIAGAVVGAVVVVIIVIIIVIFIMRRKRDNKERMNEMNSKPRNNQDIPKVVVHPHLVTPEKLDKYNKGYEKNEKELEYADLKFDDTPRSRKPVQILYEPTNYAEVAWPRV